jgi:uncharacterized membrane protein YadS
MSMAVGVSEIVAVKTAVEAKDEDASAAIAALLVLGAIALLALPLIGHALGLTDHSASLWAGLAKAHTAQAAAHQQLILLAH